MLFMALPPLFSEFVAALIGAVMVLFAIRHKAKTEVPLETRLTELTDKVRRPWHYKMTAPKRWMRG
jgi:hypothetical protein